MPLVLALWRLRQEDLYECVARLAYTMSYKAEAQSPEMAQ